MAINNKELIMQKSLEEQLSGYDIFQDSMIFKDNSIFLIVRDGKTKYLLVIGNTDTINSFDGTLLDDINIDSKSYKVKRCPLNHNNAIAIRNIFVYLNPSTCGQGVSFGTGDRLGIATPAHIEAFNDKNVFPVLAQQSVRELARTGRSWQEVMDDAIWGCLEAGYKKPFGADADHIKHKGDLREAADAGFTMFTIDPSDYIQDISSLNKSGITKKYNSYDDLSNIEKKYLNKKLKLDDKEYFIERDILIPIFVKYKSAIDNVKSLYGFLKDYKNEDFDFEVSMDEIDEPVTPLEHYFIARELIDAGVSFQNLALRFAGRWEKAVDYIGDLNIFESELKTHASISKELGGYKLSLHSGSEKFSTYKAFSELTEGNFHIKTAGTSWLEALRSVAKSSSTLFRNIYSFGYKCFEKDRDSYHLTTDTSKLQDINNVSDSELAGYLDIAEARQILHVTFGSILTSKNENNKYLFREKIYSELFENESMHYEYITSNIKKHLDLLKS